MSNHTVTVRVIVEGPSERSFFRDVLAPYMMEKRVKLIPQIIGEKFKGGDVRFDRAAKNIKNALSQQSDIYVSSFLDYYGINSKWPGLEDIKTKIKNGTQLTSVQIGNDLSLAFGTAFKKKYGDEFERRFIPFLIVHEYEALLFSDPDILSETLKKDPSLLKKLKKNAIHNILEEFKNCPELINNNPQTAPSKRLIKLYSDPKGYNKIQMGTIISKAIGIEKMREQCPHFHAWLETLENLKPL